MGDDDKEFRYGDGGTIHDTKLVNVETDANGNVVAVWFRCMMLPFDHAVVEPERAADMRRAYNESDGAPAIKAVVFEKRP